MFWVVALSVIFETNPDFVFGPLPQAAFSNNSFSNTVICQENALSTLFIFSVQTTDAGWNTTLNDYLGQCGFNDSKIEGTADGIFNACSTGVLSALNVAIKTNKLMCGGDKLMYNFTDAVYGQEDILQRRQGCNTTALLFSDFMQKIGIQNNSYSCPSGTLSNSNEKPIISTSGIVIISVIGFGLAVAGVFYVKNDGIEVANAKNDRSSYDNNGHRALLL